MLCELGINEVTVFLQAMIAPPARSAGVCCRGLAHCNHPILILIYHIANMNINEYQDFANDSEQLFS